MIIFAALLLTILSFVAIAVPFLRNKDNGARAWSYEFEDSPTLSGNGPTMLKQLETDHNTGILSDEDYRLEQASFQGTSPGLDEVNTEGSSILEDDIERKVSGLRGVKTGSDDDIERRIAGLRGGKAAPGDDVEDKIRQLRRTSSTPVNQPVGAKARQKKARFCPQCGAGVKSDGRFCAQCGEPLT